MNSEAEAMKNLGVRQLGDPCLSKIAPPVDFATDPAGDIADKLIDTVRKAAKVHNFTKGFGLAAPQLGISKRAFVFGKSLDELKFVANPEFVFVSEDTFIGFEGCLSFFDVRGKVERPEKVVVAGRDRNGKPIEFSGELEHAGLICHEIDHLNGILYSQRMDEKERLIDISDYRKIKNTT